MWICPECSEEVEDSFDICWNCSAVRAIDGKESESAGPAGTGLPAVDREGGAKQHALPLDASPGKAEEIPLKVFIAWLKRPHSLAVCCIWTLRVLAALTVFWGFLSTIDHLASWQQVRAVSWQVSGASSGSSAVAFKGALGMLTVFLISAIVATVLFALGEIMRVLLSIDKHTQHVQDSSEA